MTLFLKVNSDSDCHIWVHSAFLCHYVCLRYILDLNKEQEACFAKKVEDIALEAGFEPWHEGTSNDVHAVFVQHIK